MPSALDLLNTYFVSPVRRKCRGSCPRPRSPTPAAFTASNMVCFGAAQRKVVTVGRAFEAVLRVAHIGAGDHPADAILSLQNLPRLAAGIVQLLQGNPFLVRRHLKHGIGGGVDDPLAGFALLLAVIPDDVGAGIGQVAQDAPAGLLLEGVQNLFGKPLGKVGRGWGRSHRRFPNGRWWCPCPWSFPSAGRTPVGAAALGRQVTPSILPSPAAVMLGMSSFGEVAQARRVLTPHVPEGLRVGHRADAEGIQNDQKYSLHTITLYEFLIKRLKAFYSPQDCGQRPLPLKTTCR